MVASPSVGADIESICGKCGDVWHVVAAKVGERVMKVVCKQCGNQHRHRPPEGTVKTTAPKVASARKTGAGGGRSRAKAEPVPETPSVEADPSRPVRQYGPAEAYTPGDRIDHPQFGRGVVESSPGPGKVQVFFSSGRRVLAAAKAASTIGAPPRRDE